MTSTITITAEKYRELTEAPAKLQAQVNTLEGENHDLQRKLGILEKETYVLVSDIILCLEPEAGKLMRLAIKANYTAIATLLEQP